MLTACGQNAQVSWQEQYDLGIRYLEDGNYEEAIIAFTAAIEIDPKQAPAYVGRGDTYISVISSLDAETSKDAIAEYFSNAEKDYLEAISLIPEDADIYLKLADLYIAMGDDEAANAILQQGYEATGSSSLAEAIEYLNANKLSAFRQRPGYIPFEELTKEHQDYIRDLMDEVIAQNHEGIWALLQNEMSISNWGINYTAHGVIYTECDGYRLKYGGGPNGGSIEMRPESGEGYYCKNLLSTDEENFDDYLRIVGVGHCEDWNWNGDYQLYQESGMGWNEAITSDTGRMVNGLLDGIVHRTGTQVYLEDFYDIPAGTTKPIDFTKSYKNGVYLDGVETGPNGTKIEERVYGCFGAAYLAGDISEMLWND